MILGSKEIDGKKIYSFELTEKEFNNLIEHGKLINKPVEYAKGKGRFILKYIKSNP